MDLELLRKTAEGILQSNDRGGWTCPAPDLYPHQWLWDSAFVAIGLANTNPKRAASEITSLLEGQWTNGMIPHMIIRDDSNYWAGTDFWQSHRVTYAPKSIATSGITQPPMAAIAALRVAQSLPQSGRHVFLAAVLPRLIAYHNWLYRERCPKNTGLIVLIHPWENGLDNTPPWMDMLARIGQSGWAKLAEELKLQKLVGLLRQDVRVVPPGERLSDLDAMRCINLAVIYRNQRYDSHRILRRPTVALESLVSNSILVVANEALAEMATLARAELPSDLMKKADSTRQALEELWDNDTGQYYPRDYTSGRLIKSPSIATFLPLYSGCISPDRAKQLVSLLTSTSYWPDYPVPSVPIDDPDFDDKLYWQGPSWVNINWLIIKGLERYGYTDIAQKLTLKTLGMISNSGFSEYFSPITGQGLGADNFSWTAALLLDLINSSTPSKK
jgi:hypothetical protein